MRDRYILGIYLALLCACLILSAPEVAQAQLSDSNETDYYAVFMEGKKVGFAIQSRVVAEGKVITTQKVSITVSRADVPVTIDATETRIETTGGEPLGFQTEQQLGAMTMKE